MANQKIIDAPFNHPNLVEFVPKDTLKKIGETVIEDSMTDLRSRTTWDQERRDWLRLYMGHTEEKTFPWKNSANVPVPILTTAVIQFQARAYDALMPAKNKIKVDNVGFEDRFRAERIQKHMNYQVDVQMQEFEEDWDIGLFQLAINGSLFKKTFFDPVLNRNKSIYRPVENVIVPYHTDPRTSPERITDALFLTADEIKRRQEVGAFIEEEEMLKPGNLGAINTVQDLVKIASDKIEGWQNPSEEEENPRTFMEQHRNWDLDGDGIAEPYVITVDFETRKVARITKRIYRDGNGNVSVYNYWTHYYFFPNPEGFYGLGFGAILKGLNEAAKSILDQIIDAGTLANIQGGLINRRSGIKKGDLSFKMGEFKGVDVNTDDLRKAIFPFNFQGPSTVLFSVLNILFDSAQKVTTVSEALTGALPSSDTPATAIVNSVEQGLKVFSIIVKRIHRKMKGELNKLYVLNSFHTTQAEYEKILGESFLETQRANGQIADVSADYQGTMDIVPVSDPNVISRAEKVALAEATLQAVMNNPINNQNPIVISEAYKRFYEAIGVPEPEKLNPPPPPPPEPPDLPQTEEIAMFIQEQNVEALPHQNHLLHLDTIDAFRQSEFFNQMSAFGKQLLDQHEKQHIAFQYLVEVQGQEQGIPMGAAGVA
jgi:hypothetical protein